MLPIFPTLNKSPSRIYWAISNLLERPWAQTYCLLPQVDQDKDDVTSLIDLETCDWLRKSCHVMRVQPACTTGTVLGYHGAMQSFGCYNNKWANGI